MRVKMAFDSTSVRWKDDSGYLHVDVSHITKAAVNPYYGSEIPDAEILGLERGKIYMGLRDPEELKKSLNTWKGLPLHIEHHIDSADNPQKLTRVGSIGTDVKWNAPYVDAPLTIWDGEAIRAVESGQYKELSCAYRYEPDFTAGEYEGKKYDFVMRNIRGNHVALVEEGRAGPDVVVADSALKKEGVGNMNPDEEKKENISEKPQDVEQKEVDLAQSIIDLHRVDPDTGKIVDITEDEDKLQVVYQLLNSIADEVDPEILAKIKKAIEEIKPEAGKEKVAENPVKEQAEPQEEQQEAEADEEEFSEDEDAEEDEEDDSDGKSVFEDDEDEENAEPDDNESDEEDFSEAMGKAGLDAENPDEAEAFAKGVRVGKKKFAPERVRKNAFDEGVKYGKQLVSMGNKQKQEQEEKPANVKQIIAKDAALRRVKANAMDEAKKHYKALYEAAEKVAPMVGRVDAMSFDSADDIYRYVLKQSGVNPKDYPRNAWRGMVDMLQKQQTTKFAMAADSKAVKFEGHFSNLNKIKVN